MLVLNFGQIEELKDLNTHNLSLDLINKKVYAFGAVSKNLEGEIVGMFYRYKSVGGIEYIADFLIGGAGGNGCLAMATIWQSAWREGKGNQIASNKLRKISEQRLIDLYEDKTFVPSFNLDKLILKTMTQ